MTKKARKYLDAMAQEDPHVAAASEAGGQLMRAHLPSQRSWKRYLDNWAPGCGASVPVEGTGGQAPCGATVNGRLHLCAGCEKS